MATTKISFILVLLVLVGSAQALEGQLLYTFIVHYDEGNLTASDVGIASSELPTYSFSQTDYILQILSFKGVILYNLSFGFDFIAYGAMNRDWFDSEGNQIFFPNYTPPEKTTSDVSLVIPYFPNARVIQILREASPVLVIDVSEHAACNENGACDSSETLENCPQDCKQPLVQPSKSSWLLGGIAIVILIVVFMVVMRSGGGREGEVDKYVKRYLEKGFSEEQIREQLRQAGVKKREIDREFKKVHSKKAR